MRLFLSFARTCLGSCVTPAFGLPCCGGWWTHACQGLTLPRTCAYKDLRLPELMSTRTDAYQDLRLPELTPARTYAPPSAAGTRCESAGRDSTPPSGLIPLPPICMLSPSAFNAGPFELDSRVNLRRFRLLKTKPLHEMALTTSERLQERAPVSTRRTLRGSVCGCWIEGLVTCCLDAPTPPLFIWLPA